MKPYEEIVKNYERLEEAIKIIMNEWGYTRERVIEWLDEERESHRRTL